MKPTKLKTEALKLVAKIAYQEARISANSSCIVFSYQPKLPTQVKQLRKF